MRKQASASLALRALYQWMVLSQRTVQKKQKVRIAFWC